MKSFDTPPKFNQHQQVRFLGGNGTILFCQPDGKHWLYGVEMPLGIEPDMGRIGQETIVLLPETELFTDRAQVAQLDFPDTVKIIMALPEFPSRSPSICYSRPSSRAIYLQFLRNQTSLSNVQIFLVKMTPEEKTIIEEKLKEERVAFNIHKGRNSVF